MVETMRLLTLLPHYDIATMQHKHGGGHTLVLVGVTR